MHGIIFCVCSTLAIPAPSTSAKRCRKEHKKIQGKKESQQNQSRWRIWSHDTAWGIQTCLPRLHQKRPGKTKSESQNVPLSSLNVQQTGTERPVMGAGSSDYSEWNIDEKWSSQEWKSGDTFGARTGRPMDEKFVIDIDMDSDTAAESDFSLKSRSFLNRVWMIDCERCWTVLQKIQCKTLTNVLWSGNVYVFDVGSICIHGKELFRQFTFHQKHRGRSDFKADVRHIWNVDSGTIGWDFFECLKSAGKILHGNNYLRSLMKKSSVSRMQRFMYSQILCYVLERWIRTQHQILFGSDSWDGSKIHHNTELWTQLTENRWNSSGIFSQDSPHCSLLTKSKSSWAKWANQNNSKDDLSSCRCSVASYGGLKTTKRNVVLITHLCLFLQKDFQQDVGHSSDLGQRQSGIPQTKKDQEENGIQSLNWWWLNSEKADTQFSEPRVHCPEERSKAKGVENYQYTSGPMGIRLKLFLHNYFCQSAQCLRSSLRFVWWIQDVPGKNGRLVLAGQSDPLFEPASLLMKTLTPSTEVLAQEDLLQKYQERVERLSQQNRVRSRLASLILNWCLAFTHHMWWCVFWYIRAPRIRLLRTRWRWRRWIHKNVSWFSKRVPNTWRPIVAARQSQRTA